MTFPRALLIAGLALAASGPLAAATPIRVTRFHLPQAIVPGPVAVTIAPDASPAQELEAKTYIDAVAAALVANGFTRVDDPAAARCRVVVSVHTERVELPPAEPPFSIGLGGGGVSGGRGGGVGLGGSVEVGVGKRQPRAKLTTELAARIAEATPTGTVVWEGRASHALVEQGKFVQPAEESEKLARALFKDFPGQSGRTISVK